MTTPIDFYFDPGCPWTWITSRWVAEVAPRRELEVRWLTYSLRYHNRDNEIPPQFAAAMAAQYGGLRVLEAARDAEGDEAVGRLYTALGARIHHDGDRELAGLADAVAEAGVGAALVEAADDARWDAVIEASTEDGEKLVGNDVGVPIIVVPGARSTYFGPVLSPAPTGDDAVALWDAFVAFGRVDGVYELKRTREVGPEVGSRPS